MSAQNATLGRVLAGELLTLRPAEYFIIAGDECTEFVRVSRRARMEVLLRMAAQDEAEVAFEEFCRELSEHDAYFGQPVRVLLTNSKAFTYFKRLEDVTPAHLFDKLATIPKHGLETLQTVVPIRGSKIFAWQAIDREYLESIGRVSQSCGIQVTEILTLAAHLLIGGPIPESNAEAIYIYRLPSAEPMYAVFTVKGDVLVIKLAESARDQESITLLTQLEETYGLSSRGKRLLFHAEPVVKTPIPVETHRLGQLLQIGPRKQRTLRALSHRVANFKVANSLRVALNSTRLLATILLSATALLLAVAGITAAWSSSLAEPIEGFQHRYSTKLSLTHQLDSLQDRQEFLGSQQGQPRQTAAIISTFCQQSFRNLFLTELTVQCSEAGNILIEAKGASRRESTVFALSEHLAGLVEPHTVTVNSLRPQQRSARGVTDTLFAFGLSMTIND